MIELQGIWRTYKMGQEELHALADIQLTIGRGEHVAIMGPSGSGKSTLLNVIGLLDRATAGSYVLDGRDVTGLQDDELSAVRQNRIGFVFQSYHLLTRLDAVANVALPMIFAGVPRKERLERATHALEQVGLADRMTHRPSEMSGGQRQRVAIARSTIMRPAVLLADEPTGNLDSKSGGQVLELLDGLNQDGLTLLVVTHDPAVARRADRVLVLGDGRLVREWKGSEVVDLEQLFGEARP
ncbi:MAG: putative ABC transport system ATP-binding protein [Planctomycetota bacterium]